VLPGIYDFAWDEGHIIFLGIFYTVVVVVLSTVVIALFRALRRSGTANSEAAAWHADFEDLPARDRRCRHELSGEVASRTCENCFDCRHCADHPRFVAAAATAAPVADASLGATVAGFAMPADRLYHRGHTWVREESDGTLTIGLDDLGSHLMGRPDAIVLPQPGTKLTANGTAWVATKNGVTVRVMAPIEGDVIATGAKDDDWILKLRPEGDRADTRHLLDAAEARPWMLREVERLHLALASEGVGAALADGGTPVDDLAAVIPADKFDDVCGMLFLEP
jgi:glycine cleavage system H protein